MDLKVLRRCPEKSWVALLLHAGHEKKLVIEAAVRLQRAPMMKLKITIMARNHLQRMVLTVLIPCTSLAWKSKKIYLVGNSLFLFHWNRAFPLPYAILFWLFLVPRVLIIFSFLIFPGMTASSSSSWLEKIKNTVQNIFELVNVSPPPVDNLGNSSSYCIYTSF